ncbi:Solute carrier family 35 member G1 [Halotydeus destructor]|nr:Solute carrier family 35 member G1 [Halotydeus destructor]
MSNEDGDFVKRLRKIPLAGLILATLSASIFATGSFMVKLTPNVHPIEVVIARSLGQLYFVLPYNICARYSFKGAPGERWSLLIRGILGFLAFSLAYTAFNLLPLGDASTIICSAPVYVSIFACLMLGEACGIFQGVVILFTLSGVVLISKPSFIFGGLDSAGDNTSRLEGIALSLFAALSQGLSFVYMRKLQKTPASVTIAWLSMVSIALGVTCLFVLNFVHGNVVKWPTEFTRNEWLTLTANGICGTFAQLTLTIACKIEEAGLVALARTFGIVVAFVYQIAFLDEPISWTSILGAAIVTGGVAISAVRRVISERKSSPLITEPETMS